VSAGEESMRPTVRCAPVTASIRRSGAAGPPAGGHLGGQCGSGRVEPATARTVRCRAADATSPVGSGVGLNAVASPKAGSRPASHSAHRCAGRHPRVR
jgi:hypothetical protein